MKICVDIGIIQYSKKNAKCREGCKILTENNFLQKGSGLMKAI